jgi:hypothetical protein
MVKIVPASPLLVVGLCLLSAPALAADPVPPIADSAAPPVADSVSPSVADSAGQEDLQRPQQRDTRNSAYTLPAGMWAFNAGALGVGGGDIYAKLGVARGLGAGIQLEMNLAHVSFGLLNIRARWHFIDTRYFNLGASLGFWYGHGDWFWLYRGLAQDLVSKIDVIRVPVTLDASTSVASWLAFDLGLEYTYADVFGTLDLRGSAYRDVYIGARQFVVRPGVRFFLSNTTSVAFSADLPAYTAVPVGVEGGNGQDGKEHTFDPVPFSKVWSFEAGLRSRFQPGMFGNLRLHYSEVARILYGAVFYPSFELEVRL